MQRTNIWINSINPYSSKGISTGFIEEPQIKSIPPALTNIVWWPFQVSYFGKHIHHQSSHYIDVRKVSSLRRCLHFCSNHRVALFNYVISILILPWSSNQSKYQNDSIMFLKIIILLKNLPHKPYLCILANWFLRQMIILISCISPKTFLFRFVFRISFHTLS